MKVMSGYDKMLNLINIIKKVENNAGKELKVANVPNFDIPAYKKVSKEFDVFVKTSKIEKNK